MNETPIVISRPLHHLVGMLHRSTGRQDVGVLMMVAGGPQYRIGGHRQLVLWARKLAAQGFPVLRFDFSGMGDSSGESLGFDQVEEQVRDAVDRMFRETPSMTSVVLWGECNACSASLFYAHQDTRVSGVVMLNPWVRTEQGQAKTVVRHYYLNRIKQRAFWGKLFRLEFDAWGSLQSALKLVKASLAPQGVVPAAAARASAQADKDLPLPDRMLYGLTRYKGSMMLVMSGRDMIATEFDVLLKSSPAWRQALADRQTVRHDLPYADHTFSTAQWRDQVAAWGIEWLGNLNAVPKTSL